MTSPSFKQPRSLASNGRKDSVSIKRGGAALLSVGIVITLIGAAPFLGGIARTIVTAIQNSEALPFALGGLIYGTLVVGVGVLLIVVGSRKLAHNVESSGSQAALADPNATVRRSLKLSS